MIQSQAKKSSASPRMSSRKGGIVKGLLEPFFDSV